jgi:hypothetical protein
VFAGAARAAVFSRPEVIRRVKADFVPVALKAALVNHPPRDPEGLLYREIGRSKPAPQGICVVNSAGKVLDWVLMFDDERSVLAFLEHARKRFHRYPDARKPVAAERYMKFPSEKLPDVEDSGKAALVLERHEKGTSCPGKLLLPRGTVVARLFGRALGKDGKPLADTLRQEHYVEDRFPVGVGMQERLAEALAGSGDRRFRLGDDLARLLVSHAYLGQLDVNPSGAPGGKSGLVQCEFWGRRVSTAAGGLVRLAIEGRSKAAGASRDVEGDGRRWQHEVQLSWQGLIEMREGRISRLLLVARGREKLRWGNQLAEMTERGEVARLPGGHPIDLACDVRYGILGEPVAEADVGNPPPSDLIVEVPDEARRPLVGAFGPTFVVFREKVQDHLDLAEVQKELLEQRLIAIIQDARAFFQKQEDRKPHQREKEHASYRRKVQDGLAEFLKKTLTKGQQARLRQLELQQEGLFAVLSRAGIGEELKITDEQRRQLMSLAMRMQKTVEPLIREAQAGKSRPEDIGPRVMKVRQEYQGKLEAVLSEGQKKQWKKMLGKRFRLDD